jgi:hypothetical protein
MKVTPRRIAVLSASSLALIGLSATAAGAAVTAPTVTRTAAAPQATSPGSLTSVVTGTFNNADGKGTFNGTFTPQKFSVVNGVLEATGVLKGTLTDANGTKLGTVSQTVTDAVNTSKASNAAAAPAACGILNLLLGPLNLNLLGLVVTLNQVHLVITAVPGAGNLLGNLLCAVANLLNGGGSLTSLSALLNELLAALGL